MNKDFLKVRTPAKLILSGEHSVIHGHPAISMAVNRYTNTIVRWSSPLHFSFNLMGIDFKRKLTLQALQKLKSNLKEKYCQYNLGHLPIRKVLKYPFELSLFTAINVIDKLKSKLPLGIDIVTDSNIPIGCGMGSSAASVVGILHALTHFLNIELSLNDYIQLGVESENLQHGKSGCDVHTVYNGGSIRYQNKAFQSRQFSPFPMTIIQTGRPQSSTGECVSQTRTHFKNSTIGDDFASITNKLEQALIENNIAHIQENIRLNHRLLHKIGVVPYKINSLINDLEKMGAAAKICGAGSVAGDQAGIVLVVSEVDISSVAKQYGYRSIPIKNDNRGSHVI